MKTISVKIPSGIRDGEKVRLLGQGKQGQNGGKNGDMFIKINIQNKSWLAAFEGRMSHDRIVKSYFYQEQ